MLPILLAEVSTGVGAGFTADQVTSISTSLTTAANNVMSMFISLLPVMAIIAGVAFGIALIKGQFNKVKRAK